MKSLALAYLPRLPFPLLAAGLLSMATPAFAQTYSFTAFSLGPYEPVDEYSTYDYSQARAVNSSGQIVGLIAGTFNMDGAHFASGTTSADIGTLGTPALGGHHTDVLSLNDTNDAVGWSENTGSTIHAYYKPSAGPLQDLGGFGGTNSQAYKINNKRQILAQSDMGGTNRYHLYHNGTTMTFFLGTGFYPADLNENDQIVGWAPSSPRIYNIATHTYTILTGPLGSSARPSAINNNGAIAGRKGNALFYYEGGVLTTYGSNINSVSDLNDGGRVVGSYGYAENERAFTYTKAGGFVDLSGKLSASAKAAGWVLITAEGVNAGGTIVGLARRPTTAADPEFYDYLYVYRAYRMKPLILVPIPTPPPVVIRSGS